MVELVISYTIELAKELAKVFSTVFFLVLALFCQNSFSCATCLWNNISRNDEKTVWTICI